MRLLVEWFSPRDGGEFEFAAARVDDEAAFVAAAEELAERRPDVCMPGEPVTVTFRWRADG